MKTITGFFSGFALFFCFAAAYAQESVPRPEGVNLRILDDNVWSYSKDYNAPAWEAIGADCTIAGRSKGFLRLFNEYKPDIFTFQEFSPKIMDFYTPRLKEMGYSIALEDDPSRHNWTPIYYSDAALELLKAEYVRFEPKCWSDVGSKGFTAAVFRHKSTMKVFVVITTHLWWKSDSSAGGSNMARAAQACLILAHTQLLLQEFDCPVFLTGDMNCTENSMAVRTYLDAGFKQCYKIATEYGDTHRGHHMCNNNGFGETEQNLAITREKGAIDHCLLYDVNGSVEIRRFDCVMDEYTLPLTDHYPNVIDAVVK